MSIDFVSTRDGVDPETARGARLLVAVIAQAIRDASEPTTAPERERRANLSLHAVRALWWLFEPHPAFVCYAHLIGGEAKAITDALLADAERSGGNALFSVADRHALQLRHRWWFQAQFHPERTNAPAR